ncbi:MAG TPA: hypothetical protein VGN78_12140 [Solirubrobacteraceae bacterium]|nr:hypothetical protein [Solirubrobacteraceae bacterium]
MVRALSRAACALSLGVLVFAAAASARSSAPPSAPDQSVRDGCQRASINQLFLKSPEWVYVYRDPSIRVAEGITHVTHAAKDDAPGEHQSYDFNSNLVPDPQYRYLLGGSAAQSTSNYSRDAGAPGEEFRRLHYEWESGTLPFFAWPTEGDRVKLWGSWIWDCGHWTTGSRITGERTELHPLNGIAVTRRSPYRARGNESQTDLFISQDGNIAHAVEECARTHQPIAPDQYGPDLRTCIQTPANRLQPVSATYSFFVPAPPKPSRTARLTYRATRMVSGNAASESVRVLSNGLAVSVSLRAGRGAAAAPGRYGKSYYVGWSGRQRPAPTRLKITLRTLTINHADPLPGTTPRPGLWNLYLDVNGYWKLLNDWAPGLASVRDGQRIALNRTVTISVPRDRGVSLLVAGRECDEPSQQVVGGEVVPIVKPCPVNREEFQLANDDTGTILDNYRSSTRAIGAHTSHARATVFGFPGSGPISFGDGIQGNDGYRLTYTVRRG